MAKLETVFKHATAATATTEASTNIWFSFSLSGGWQLLLRVLFNVTSGKEKYKSRFLWCGLTTCGAVCLSHFLPSLHSSWRPILKRFVDGDIIPIALTIEETRLKILRWVYADECFGKLVRGFIEKQSSQDSIWHQELEQYLSGFLCLLRDFFWD